MDKHEPRLEVICGPMFAGKTTALIGRLRAAGSGGLAVVALKPARDTRYHATRIVTHDGVGLEARCIAGGADLPVAAGAAAVVGIDEVHFFEEDFAETCRALADEGRCVVVAGVDLDHRGAPFPVMARLMESAEEVTRVTARCVRCGAKAQYTQRLAASDERIVVGGADDYEPRCAACFEPPE